MDFSITPVKDVQGHVKFLIPEGRNITDLKIAELKRNESEAKYRTLFDLSANAMLLLVNEVVVECNKAALNMLGFSSKEEVIGLTPKDISPEFQPDGSLSKQKAQLRMQEAYRDGTTRFEWYHQLKNGTMLPVDISLTHIPDNNKRILHAIWTDISAQKRLKKKFASSIKNWKCRFKLKARLLNTARI